ncbi:GH92 family glycosyl hydrolase [Prevotella cerevisiae]|uniref:GH92 family glycosyl hydrolase n=1 Tax=Segatella cerevisiae TaxID=2053716 RepID=A0ABT1BZ42_9BACT|nr:GH92 family glycosyl hydrolase [Segatella cerevisiae]MCO6026352.1 GH92 family glycosyl hydrolase [Segatella cerevisiae]
MVKSIRLASFAKFVMVIVLTWFMTGTLQAGHHLIQYVDPMIGTGAVNGDFSHGRDPLGQCMPAVLAPYGMNAWTPQTEESEGHGVCPYYANKSRIQGFRNSHYIDGSATQDYGSVTIMPLLDTLKCQPEERASAFSHTDEVSRPDYYRVPLFKGTIIAEMTGTSRTGIFRFTYKKAGMAHLVITPNSDRGEGRVRIDPEHGEVFGENLCHRFYLGQGQPTGFSGWFIIQVKRQPSSYGVYSGSEIMEHVTFIQNEKKSGAYLSFPVKAGEQIIVKVASSFVSVDGARHNMEVECPGWNFNRVRSQLAKQWERHLSVVEVTGGNKDALTKFYTSLYRTAFCPHAFSDADGRYPSFAGGKTIEKTSGTYFTDYSLWDTFRALHPLITLFYPHISGEMMQSLVDMYEQSGWLPVFPAWNSFTQEMIGDHTASLLAEAYLKGVRNFDIQTAYQAMLKMAFQSPATYDEYKDGKGRRALKSYMKYGFIPLEDPVKEAYHGNEQTSRTMEYAYDDYCVARLAEYLGHLDAARLLYKRSKNYQNVFDPRTGYVNGRHADGKFYENTKPDQNYSFITQGTPCQYSWYVPHDVYGLMKCMGGRKSYILKLDSMFSQKRIWHGNEPCHQIGFMYDYAGQPWKTQYEVRQIMEREYGLGANGLSGNDDSGQMSAWYVFAALGFYPVCPTDCYYAISSPSFDKVVIRLEGGKTFMIVAHHASSKNIYIQSAKLNGKPFNQCWIRHSTIVDGGKLELLMGPQPEKSWGISGVPKYASSFTRR